MSLHVGARHIPGCRSEPGMSSAEEPPAAVFPHQQNILMDNGDELAAVNSLIGHTIMLGFDNDILQHTGLRQLKSMLKSLPFFLMSPTRTAIRPPCSKAQNCFIVQ